MERERQRERERKEREREREGERGSRDRRLRNVTTILYDVQSPLGFSLSCLRKSLITKKPSAHSKQSSRPRFKT